MTDAAVINFRAHALVVSHGNELGAAEYQTLVRFIMK